MASASRETDPAAQQSEDQEVLALVSRACAGDHAAFEAIYRRYCGRIYGLCLRLCADVVEAETATQDTFVRAWQKLDSFAGSGSLGGWLSRLATHAIADRRRRRKRRERLIEELPVGSNIAPSVESTVESTIAPTIASTIASTIAPTMASAAAAGATPGSIRSGLSIDLERAIARLPAAARTVFVLHDVEGFRHREIAELMGTAAGTSKAQLHRARKLLRVMLAR